MAVPASSSSSSDEHVVRNRAAWDEMATQYFNAGRRSWASDDMAWGVFCVPQAKAPLMPEVDGRDCVELGCGTAYVSSWMARRGGRVVGIDNSPQQLASAATFQGEFGLRFPLIHGNAERLPFPDESFDVAVSEYGASIWCDPYRWIPEAARVLRPGGELSFLTNGLLFILCVPDTDAEGPAADRLLRPYRGMHRFEWPEEEGVEFHLGFGDWVRLLRGSGFEVEDFIEVWPEPGATTSFKYVTPAWAEQWPAEQIWRVRKRR